MAYRRPAPKAPQAGLSLSAIGLGLALACLAPAAPAAAAGVLQEVWVGGYEHSLDYSHGKESGTQEVEVEADTVPAPFLHFIGSPQIAVTMAVNTRGYTDFGGAALLWERHLIGHITGTIELGLDANNGVRNAPPGPAGAQVAEQRLLLGSNVLFREAAGLNYQINPRWEIGVQYIHNSSGQILGHGPNEGINEAGMRVGYRFQ